MELTTKGRYAVMAMADIAAQAGTGAVPLSQVAERQGLPLAYLEQLFGHLRRAGLVESARGRAGGYRLSRSPEEISVGAVMSAVDEETEFTRCAGGDSGCAAGTRCITHDLWTELSDVTARFLDRASLADVIGGSVALQRARQAGGSARRLSGPRRTYLDFNATAPLCHEAREAMVAALDVVGNPSSVHADGRKARAIIEEARERVARLVGAKPSEVVFTSGATEANSWALGQPWSRIFLSGIEHDSVLAPARASTAEIAMLPVSSGGAVSVVSNDFGGHAGSAVIALQMANNETGIIQPVAEAAALARAAGVAVHCDAVQAAGRLPIKFADLGVDTLSISAHKLGGPKGVGALINRDHVDLVPLIRGGGHERRRRAGTENVAAIAGFGAAAERALKALEQADEIAKLRDHLEAGLLAISPSAVIIGRDQRRICNTSAVALPGKLAETLVIKLDLAGISVSAGSACSSGKVGASHVLTAMGLPPEIAQGTVRVSLGAETKESDIAAFLAAWRSIAGESVLAA